MSQENSTEEAGLPVRPKTSHARQELPRPGRTQLLFEFDMRREVQSKEQDDLTYFLPEYYAPSIQPLADLQSIAIADLHLDKRSDGGVVFVKTIESGLRAAAIHTIVEDEEGLAERLAVYNIDLNLDAEEFLPEGTILAIKEPTLTASSSGGYTIRVDHPSDLVLLNPTNPQIPPKLLEELSATNKTADEWKQEGNKAYGKKNFEAAISAYTRGVEACKDDTTSIRYDLLRNRAAANIFLGRFEDALADAKAAVTPSDDSDQDAVKNLNAKAYERAGHAAYSLGRYNAAKDLYVKALALSPDSKESTEALAKIRARRQEQTTGKYDFDTMARTCSKKRNRLDHASYLTRTEIRDAGKHGRGIFAIEAIPMGGLVLCEKALCVAFPTDPILQSISILNSKERRKAEGTKPQLLFGLIAKLSRNSELAHDFSKLYDGKTISADVKEVDGRVAIDAFRALSILDHNSIGCPTTRSSSLEAIAEARGHQGHKGTGLWLRTSYINHACNGNAFRSFIGDMIIIRATRDIAKDEEIFMPYMFPNVDHLATQEEFKRIWGFTCDCEICMVEASDSTTKRKKRIQIYEELRKHHISTRGKINPQKLDDFYPKMQSAYSGTFDAVPKMGLIAIGQLLVIAYSESEQWDKIISSHARMLKDMGFDIVVAGNKERDKRRHAMTQEGAVNTAIKLAIAYKHQRQKSLQKLFRELSRSLWTIVYGCEYGWEKMISSALSD